MAATPPQRRTLTPFTAEVLARCYRGEAVQDVLERAMRLLATSDGHLDTTGRIKNLPGGRPETRRPT